MTISKITDIISLKHIKQMNKKQFYFSAIIAVLMMVLCPQMLRAEKTAKAVYNSEEQSLTFYYDDKDSEYTANGLVVYQVGNDIVSYPDWIKNIKKLVTSVCFDDSFKDYKPTKCAYWFYQCDKLESISGIANLDTSEATSMTSMFFDCEKLTELDLSGFDTGKVTDMSSMFGNCYSLATLDLSSFDTSNVTDMKSMFDSCESLESLDLSSFDTSNVTSMKDMFQYCYALTELDLTSFNTSNVTNMDYMFFHCEKLVTIYASENFSIEAVEGTDEYMFTSCTSLSGAISYDTAKTDKTYANSTTGYFCDKANLAGKVLLSTDGTTLTFVYDAKSHVGETVYALNTGNDTPEWKDKSGTVTTVVFDSSFSDARPTTCYEWFHNFSALTDITGLNNLNTSEVTNMKEMFYGCTSLATLDLSSFNTSKVTDMSQMFRQCKKLTTLDLSSFDTSNVKDMGSMFDQCESLESLDLSNFDTSNVTSMENMFQYCYALTELNLTGFNTSNVTNMDYMFFTCKKLVTIYASENFSVEAVSTDKLMFSDCTSLSGAISYDAAKTDKTYANATDGYFCYLSNFGAKAVLEDEDKTLTFYYDARPHTGNTIYFLKADGDTPAWVDEANDNTTIATVKFDETFKEYSPTTCYKWFLRLAALTTVTGLDNFNTSAVTNMSYMFNDCKSLTALDLSTFDVSNVTDMSGMFSGCKSLTTLNLSSFNTKNVTNMYIMFQHCDSIQEVDLSSFDIQNVTTMASMFERCEKLKSVDFSGDGFISTKLNTINGMFLLCSSLESVTFGSGFTAENIENMYNLFYGCSNLKTLDLSNLNTSKVTTMASMFYDCKELESLTVNNFNMKSVKSLADMFTNASNLKTLTLKSVPYLADGTFNSVTWEEVNYQLDDNSVVYTGSNNLPAATTATYTRDVTNNWGTAVMPFAAVSNDDVQFYELSAAGSDDLTFSPVESVEANTPCVFKKKNATSVTFAAAADNATVSSAAPAATTAVDGLSLNGTYEKLTDKTGIYYIAADKFWQAEDAITVNPFRAYFTGSLPSAAKVLNIIVEEADGSATTIGTLENGTLRSGKFLENNRIVIFKNGKKYNTNGQIME